MFWRKRYLEQGWLWWLCLLALNQKWTFLGLQTSFRRPPKILFVGSIEEKIPLEFDNEGVDYPLSLISPQQIGQIESTECLDNLDVEEGYHIGVDLGVESEEFDFFNSDGDVPTCDTLCLN